VSDWTWEYVPDAASVIGGLTSEQIAEVEALAVRLADAVGVCRMPTAAEILGAGDRDRTGMTSLEGCGSPGPDLLRPRSGVMGQ
jgi:hypothetical protein